MQIDVANKMAGGIIDAAMAVIKTVGEDLGPAQTGAVLLAAALIVAKYLGMPAKDVSALTVEELLQAFLASSKLGTVC